MKSKALKSLYDTLLESGELFELMSEATGEWEKDKREFKDIQESFESLIEGEEPIELGPIIEDEYN